MSILLHYLRLKNNTSAKITDYHANKHTNEKSAPKTLYSKKIHIYKNTHSKRTNKNNQADRRERQTNVVTLGRLIVTICEQSDGTLVNVSSGVKASCASLPPAELSSSLR